MKKENKISLGASISMIAGFAGMIGMLLCGAAAGKEDGKKEGQETGTRVGFDAGVRAAEGAVTNALRNGHAYVQHDGTVLSPVGNTVLNKSNEEESP